MTDLADLVSFLFRWLDHVERQLRQLQADYEADRVRPGSSAINTMALVIPSEALADVAAKRRIVHACATSGDPAVVEFAEWEVLRPLAELFAHRPGYQEEWRCDDKA